MKNIQLKPATLTLVAILAIGNFSMGWAKPVEDKIEDFVDGTLDSFKERFDEFIEKVGENFDVVQNYLDNYPWKGVVQEKATSGAATLEHLRFNGHSKAIVVKPGERIAGVAQCNIDSDQCASFGVQRVILGIKGKGAQTTIGNELGIIAGKTEEKFTLIAPSEPGIYQVRFKLIEAIFEKNALDAWIDEKGNEPDGTTTIGIILVKS